MAKKPEPPASIFYTKGEVFSCPSCNEQLLKFTQDVYINQTLEWAQVERIDHIVPEQENWQTVCPYCLRDYFVELLMKTIK